MENGGQLWKGIQQVRGGVMGYEAEACGIGRGPRVQADVGGNRLCPETVGYLATRSAPDRKSAANVPLPLSSCSSDLTSEP